MIDPEFKIAFQGLETLETILQDNCRANSFFDAINRRSILTVKLSNEASMHESPER